MKRAFLAFLLLLGAASFIYQSGVPILGSTWKGAAGSSCTATGISGGIATGGTCGGLTFKQACANVVVTNTSATCSFPNNLTAGSFIIAFGGGSNSTTSTISTSSGCTGITWTQENTVSGGRASTYIGTGGTGACAVLNTLSTAETNTVLAAEVTGSTANAIDVHSLLGGFNQITTPNPIAGTSLTTTVANDVIFQVTYGWSVGGDIYTPGTGAAVLINNSSYATGLSWSLQATTSSGVAPSVTSN